MGDAQDHPLVKAFADLREENARLREERMERERAWNSATAHIIEENLQLRGALKQIRDEDDAYCGNRSDYDSGYGSALAWAGDIARSILEKLDPYRRPE